MKYLSVIILVFSQFICYGQSSQLDSLQKTFIKKNKVKHITREFVKGADTIKAYSQYDTVGNQIKQHKLMSFHSMFGTIKRSIDSNTTYWKYDNRGNVVEKKIYKNDKLTHYNQYWFDEFGNEIKRIINLSPENSKEVSIWEYNEKNEVVKSLFYKDDHLIEIDSVCYDTTRMQKFIWVKAKTDSYRLQRWVQFDKAGHSVMTVFKPFSKDKPFLGGVNIFENTYDENSREIKSTWYSNTYNKQLSCRSYTYDANGRILTKVSSLGGKESSEQVFKYTKNGQLLSETSKKSTTTYKYLKSGLIAKYESIERRSDGSKETYTEKWEYEYYR